MTTKNESVRNDPSVRTKVEKKSKDISKNAPEKRKRIPLKFSVKRKDGVLKPSFEIHGEEGKLELICQRRCENVINSLV